MQSSRSLLAPTLVAALLVGGCNSPTDPAPEPIVLRGELTTGAQVRHELTLNDVGVVRIELLSLMSRNLDTGEVFDIGTSVLSFAIGRVATDSETPLEPGALPICSPTFATGLGTEESLSVYLTLVERCALVSDPGGLEPRGIIPEGFVWMYAIQISSLE